MAHLSLNETHILGGVGSKKQQTYMVKISGISSEMLCLGLVILVTSGWFVLVGGGLKDFGNFQPEN